MGLKVSFLIVIGLQAERLLDESLVGIEPEGDRLALHGVGDRDADIVPLRVVFGYATLVVVEGEGDGVVGLAVEDDTDDMMCFVVFGLSHHQQYAEVDKLSVAAHPCAVVAICENQLRERVRTGMFLEEHALALAANVPQQSRNRIRNRTLDITYFTL